MTDKELTPKQKETVATKAEPTRPGRVFVPAVDIYETEQAIVVLADMPGVSPDKVTIDVKDDQLTLSGEVVPSIAGGETPLLQEYETGDYLRQFTLGQLVDQSKIEASLKDGVLRLVLPKVEKAKPRKIEIKAG